MELEQLRMFLAVAECRSFSSAATARLMVEWLKKSAFAAVVKLPCSATARKMRSCSGSIRS